MNNKLSAKISKIVVNFINFLFAYCRPALSIISFFFYFFGLFVARKELKIARTQISKSLNISKRNAYKLAKKNLKTFISFFIKWICIGRFFKTLEITDVDTGEISGQEGSRTKLLVSGLKTFDKIVEKKNGAVFLTAHFGLFELPALMLKKRYGVNLNAVARVPNFKILYHISNLVRKDAQMETIWKEKQSVKAFLNVLKDKKILALLIDQDSYYNNSFIPFMGKTASATTTISEVAIKNNVPIITAFCYRSGKNTFKIDIVELKYNPKSKNAPYQVVLEFNQILEKLIKKHPEQWPWWHRRWRRRPLVEYSKETKLLTTNEYLEHIEKSFAV